mgnify:FL=1
MPQSQSSFFKIRWPILSNGDVLGVRRLFSISIETETKLDNLERHSNVQRPWKPAKHKIIIPSNHLFHFIPNS